MTGLLRSLTHRSRTMNHPNGYVIYSESRRLGGVLTNLCVWDGNEWHQAPLSSWDKRVDMNAMLDWLRDNLPADAFRHRND